MPVALAGGDPFQGQMSTNVRQSTRLCTVVDEVEVTDPKVQVHV